jgi:hypothetical protein
LLGQIGAEPRPPASGDDKRNAEWHGGKLDQAAGGGQLTKQRARAGFVKLPLPIKKFMVNDAAHVNNCRPE